MITERPVICWFICHHKGVRITAVNRSVFLPPCLSPLLYKVSIVCDKAIKLALKVPRMLTSLLEIKAFIFLYGQFCPYPEVLVSHFWLIEFKDNVNWQRVRKEHQETDIFAICLTWWMRPNLCNKSTGFLTTLIIASPL